MKRSQLVFLSVISGALLTAAWPVLPLTLLIFIAWIPLLKMTEHTKRHVFFGHVFLACLLWNTGTTWWMWNSTDVGTIAAIIIESLCMTIPWWGYHIFRSRYGKRNGYISLVCFWMCYEYINHNWQLSWPWLTLGNVFASHPDWVQWYEYTGVGGGTFLILLVNIGLYELLGAYRRKEYSRKTFLITGLILLAPILSLLFTWFHYSKTPAGIVAKNNVVIVQPNVDPYTKFTVGSMEQDMVRLVHLSEEQVDTATRLILWPETAMSLKDWQSNVGSNSFYSGIFAMTNRHTQATLLSGIETMKFYGKEKATPTANKTTQGDYIDDFNAAVTIHYGEPLRFYNKSKLVPGVESMPTFLHFMSPVFEKFGGTTGGYGRDPESSVFAIAGSDYIAAPIICYESVYGEYVASYVKKGATLLTIMTNDGWWGNTPGHKQHLAYASLRAIETRRWVARSANTGISAVINEHGHIIETHGWDKQAVIKYNIPALTGTTFYVSFGDYLFKIAAAIAVLMILGHLIQKARRRFSSSTK